MLRRRHARPQRVLQRLSLCRVRRRRPAHETPRPQAPLRAALPSPLQTLLALIG